MSGIAAMVTLASRTTVIIANTRDTFIASLSISAPLLTLNILSVIHLGLSLLEQFSITILYDRVLVEGRN